MDREGKLVKYSCHLTDYISHMPDDILLSIISHLPLKEAARTTILARRWRNLWPYSVSDLDFEPPERIRRYVSYYGNSGNTIKVGRATYIDWVKKIFELHRCNTIQSLRVRFFLDTDYADDIDEWLQSALAKGVKRLELDLSTDILGVYYENCYPFPNICDPIEAVKRLHPSTLPNFSSLETLQLKAVNINGQVLEYLISNCPSLQLLCVQNSDGVTDLKINGPSISLKHLEIRSCRYLKNLEIHAPKLVSFVYVGSKIHIAIKNIQQLVKLYVGEIYEVIYHRLFPFRSCFTQLEELKLESTSPPKKDLGLKRGGSPCFPRLRKLLFNVGYSGGRKSLLIVSSLINAAPNLHEFRLELLDKPCIEERRTFEDERDPHQCLKVVEIIGFAGGTADLDLATYLSRICISLEKMVIDPRRSFREKESLREFLGDYEKMMARQCAQELKAKLSPQTKLVIL